MQENVDRDFWGGREGSYLGTWSGIVIFHLLLRHPVFLQLEHSGLVPELSADWVIRPALLSTVQCCHLVSRLG